MEGARVKAILRAAETGDKKTLQQVIAEAKVCVVDDDSNTPLMYAATSGREETLRMLLDKTCIASNQLDAKEVAYINLRNRYGWTALMQAACYGHSDAVLLLLQRSADPHLKNAWGASALVLASQGGHFSVVHTLINHGAKVDLDVDENLESCTLTPLMAAAQCGHVEVMQELLRGGAKLEVKLKCSKWTALMFAILNNKVSAVEQLLQAGAEAEVQDIQGKKAADLASGLGHHDVITLLTGGTINKISDSEFFEAVSKGNVKKVTEILAQQPGMANIEDKGGATPLMFASNKGHCEVCEVLLEAKAEVNVKDRKYGWTALMHATHNRKYEVAEKLGEYGADVNVRDNNGSTAYDIASVIGDIRMIKLIASITVKRLEDKMTPAEDAALKTTPTTPAAEKPSLLTGTGRDSMANTKNNPPPATTNTTPAAATPVGRPSRPFDLGDLRSKLQNAYRTPLPKINVPGKESSLISNTPRFQVAQSPDAPRFPSGRMSRSSVTGGSTPFSTQTHNNDSQPSLTTPKRIHSPSKSANSLPSNNSANRQRHPMNNRPFSFPGKPLPLRTSSTSNRADDRNPPLKHHHANTPSPRVTPDLWRSKPPLVADRACAAGTRQRQRANTDTTFSRIGKKNHNPTDLKAVLEKCSLERYFPIFEEQELDYELFISLCLEDLVEMGISNQQDREQIMLLITSLKAQPTSLQASSSLIMDSDVFN